MRTVDVAQITEAVAKLCVDACCFLSEDIYEALVKGKETEESPLGRDVLAQIIENADIARNEARPMCQDTGMTVVFIEIGQEVQLVGGSVEEAINAGVAKGYTEGYLRKSVVGEPLFERKNTNDNTPAVIHYQLVPGDKVKIKLAPKGFGSENKSGLKMLVPADGVDGSRRSCWRPCCTPAKTPARRSSLASASAARWRRRRFCLKRRCSGTSASAMRTRRTPSWKKNCSNS